MTRPRPIGCSPFWRRAGDEDRLQRTDATIVTAPDHLRWRDDSHFLLDGRLDGAVQVGGVNVHPGQIQDVLRAHPSVADAVVRCMAPHEGHRLKAFIVPRDETACPDSLRKALHAHAETQLGVAERPRAFTFGASLPMTEAGKPGDWTITRAT